jgi:hypothetical protein
MGQGLERRAEPVFHPPRDIGHAANLAVLAAEKRRDPIRLP